MRKVVFEMDSPEEKKHSTRFDFQHFVGSEGTPILPLRELERFRPSFYIPKPFAETAKRVRVTIEVVE